uniref:Uncharacterized protein n=1 Tax=Schlesneria paludicola TaxID=360056 RepID=A0A7C4QLW3_9PLAN
MAPFPCPSFGRRLVSRLCCLAAWLMVWGLGASAWATCGDYLQHAETSPVGDKAFDLPAAPKDPPAGPPCSGPQCREAPVLPFAPVAPPPTGPQTERWFGGLTASAPPLLDTTSWRHLMDPDALPVFGPPRDVDHVPRMN